MAILVLEESTGGIIPDDDVVPARITACAQRTAPFKSDTGEDVERIEFTFTIEDPDSPFDGQRVFGSTSTKFNAHPDCKLRAWVQEILATELQPGFQLDTDTLVGMHCRLIMGVRETERDGQTRTKNFVKDVMRPRDGHAYRSVEEEPF